MSVDQTSSTGRPAWEHLAVGAAGGALTIPVRAGLEHAITSPTEKMLGSAQAPLLRNGARFAHGLVLFGGLDYLRNSDALTGLAGLDPDSAAAGPIKTLAAPLIVGIGSSAAFALATKRTRPATAGLSFGATIGRSIPQGVVFGAGAAALLGMADSRIPGRPAQIARAERDAVAAAEDAAKAEAEAAAEEERRAAEQAALDALAEEDPEPTTTTTEAPTTTTTTVPPTTSTTEPATTTSEPSTEDAADTVAGDPADDAADAADTGSGTSANEVVRAGGSPEWAVTTTQGVLPDLVEYAPNLVAAQDAPPLPQTVGGHVLLGLAALATTGIGTATGWSAPGVSKPGSARGAVVGALAGLGFTAGAYSMWRAFDTYDGTSQQQAVAAAAGGAALFGAGATALDALNHYGSMRPKGAALAGLITGGIAAAVAGVGGLIFDERSPSGTQQAWTDHWLSEPNHGNVVGTTYELGPHVGGALGGALVTVASTFDGTNDGSGQIRVPGVQSFDSKADLMATRFTSAAGALESGMRAVRETWTDIQQREFARSGSVEVHRAAEDERRVAVITRVTNQYTGQDGYDVATWSGEHTNENSPVPELSEDGVVGIVTDGGRIYVTPDVAEELAAELPGAALTRSVGVAPAGNTTSGREVVAAAEVIHPEPLTADKVGNLERMAIATADPATRGAVPTAAEQMGRIEYGAGPGVIGEDDLILLGTDRDSAIADFLAITTSELRDSTDRALIIDDEGSYWAVEVAPRFSEIFVDDEGNYRTTYGTGTPTGEETIPPSERPVRFEYPGLVALAHLDGPIVARPDHVDDFIGA